MNLASAIAAFVASSLIFNAGAQGLFTSGTDIGAPRRHGSVRLDRGEYVVTGGGQNMWFTNDAFYFVWKKVSGDVALAANLRFLGQGVDPHRKACLLVRQNLDGDAAYADAALHGDGLTSLQYRETSGAMTREIQANVRRPARLRIEKRGKYVSMSVAGAGEAFAPAGGSFRLELGDPFYVGLGVCAHNEDVLETAIFSDVELAQRGAGAGDSAPLISTLETITISSRDRRVVWWTTNLIEAPNWSRDGATLYFNSKGRISQIPASGGEPRLVETAFATRCNNDHGISPDGSLLVISDQSQSDRRSRLYTLPISGGTPTLITSAGPSYWHGWSPNGKTLAYCAERNGEFDVYTVPAVGGAEKRLTNSRGLDDGPDYSPDGQYIYFNSDRTGQMHIWRMRSDGAAQEQVTHDEFNNWFPHPSPDGKWLVFLSYDKSVTGHPANKDVALRVMPLSGGKPEVLAKLFGGQGTINVPSWSPDGKRLAFVSYQIRN